MSIQSDVEMLSVQAVEYYAQTHHLSEGEVFDLFCKHQISFHMPLALKHLTRESRREVS